MEELRYPIGRFKSPGAFDPDLLKLYKSEIAALPGDLRQLVSELDESTLKEKYRPGGWTVRQVIHHVCDSHTNSYIRYRWTLTEDRPLIKAYNEKLWSELEDAKHAPINLSLDMLSAIHAKWTFFLDTISTEEFNREFIHPESNSPIDLFTMTALYAWHGKHHMGHIRLVTDKMKA